MINSENEETSEKKNNVSSEVQARWIQHVVEILRLNIARRGWHVPVGINLEHCLVMIGRPFSGIDRKYTCRVYSFSSIEATTPDMTFELPIVALMSDIQAMHDKLYTLAWQERQIKETRERYGSRKATDDGPTEERI